MDYDVARAGILLRDLERMTQGQAPAVELSPAPDGELPLRGSSTRAGVMRMGIRLARAALTAESHVELYENGHAGADGSTTGAVMHVHLIDDRPEPEQRSTSWIERILPVWVLTMLPVIVFVLCGIGLVTVVRWLIATVG